MQNEDYTAKNIRVLEGLEHVRKRPSMYIGSTNERGLHHLVFEVVDNSIDEAMAGHCTEINVILRKDSTVTVIDNGRGIPVDMHPTLGISGVEVALTKLNAGGKFDDKAYHVSGGLHGVGVSVVNALSEKLYVKVVRDKVAYEQEFVRGKAQYPLRKKELTTTEKNGTEITFKPDSLIFEILKFEPSVIKPKLKELAYLNSGLKITFTDETAGIAADIASNIAAGSTTGITTGITEVYLSANGIKDFIKEIHSERQVLPEKVIYMKKEEENFFLEVALQYNSGFGTDIKSFVNNICTIDGGTHEAGFKMALTRLLNVQASQLNLLKNGIPLSGDDVREGLTAIINLRITNPQFEGQTKTRLGNSEAKNLVSETVKEKFTTYFDHNVEDLKQIIKKSIIAHNARIAAKKARELVRRKNSLDFTGRLPGKLADCSTNDPEKAEIYIVEGESAGGSAKQGRDRGFQAILPLRGKILNVERATLNNALANQEIKNLITSLGCGILDEFAAEKLRYHKVVIMTDADVDGAHIRTLLLTFFFRYMRPLIDDGYLYIAQPPLYKIKSNKKIYYAFSDGELKRILSQIQEKTEIQRYKGLGEMDATQLWETTMDPSRRVILRVTIGEAERANSLFNILMGKKVEPRKKFIEDHAKEVVNLDI
ncbi:MAG: DNA topoisomerase (ATP-hydrolyzing) subunit B [Caldisericota bacterium]|nr:DNA topoisomerase (ATP-hydrolyzing) subunit B [Caldisericota bacterium]